MPAGQGRFWGFSLTELLAVVAIMLVLGAMAVPVYIERVEMSRRVSALMEARELAEAEETVGAIHGFFVPLQVLDDVKDVQGVTNTATTNPDTIEEELSVNFSLVDPNVALSPRPSQLQLNDFSSNSRVADLFNFWQGPFMKFKRTYIGNAASDDPRDLDRAGVRQIWDFPLDPWGQPFRFYSPIGLIGTSASNTSPRQFANNNFSDGVLTTRDDRFDRYAIVSYGRDGESDIDSNGDDDIIYQFGHVINETTLNLF